MATGVGTKLVGWEGSLPRTPRALERRGSGKLEHSDLEESEILLQQAAQP